MIRKLAASGRFNFETYDPLDYLQRSRFHQQLSALAEDAATQFWGNMLTYQMIRALVNLGYGNTDGLNATSKSAYNALNKLAKLSIPWLDVTDTGDTDGPSGTVDEYNDMFKQWRDEWGDPSDPVVQERIKKTAEWLHANSNNGPNGSRSLL